MFSEAHGTIKKLLSLAQHARDVIQFFRNNETINLKNWEKIKFSDILYLIFSRC